jgi:DNA-binding MarR family transcriptional regulator
MSAPGDDRAVEDPRAVRASASSSAGARSGESAEDAQSVADGASAGSAAPARSAASASNGEHPTNALDETVHQRHRLGILTITAEAKSADFGYLRDALGLTPGNLSRHLTVLEDAGLVQVTKGYEGRRPRTWVQITSAGRSALASELAALTELLRRQASPSR